MMTPRLRKFALTAHIIFSVGWLGAVACFFALAIAGLTITDAQLVRAIYLALKLITQYVITPLCFASLLTGLVSSLGSEWGLFRHYWVLIKFLITLLSTFLLLVHLQPIGYLAETAAKATLSSADLPVQYKLVVVSGAALLALIVATALSVYKPRGLTRYGWRKKHEKPLGA